MIMDIIAKKRLWIAKKKATSWFFRQLKSRFLSTLLARGLGSRFAWVCSRSEQYFVSAGLVYSSNLKWNCQKNILINKCRLNSFV